MLVEGTGAWLRAMVRICRAVSLDRRADVCVLRSTGRAWHQVLIPCEWHLWLGGVVGARSGRTAHSLSEAGVVGARFGENSGFWGGKMASASAGMHHLCAEMRTDLAHYTNMTGAWITPALN